jgi:hypothetical protein
MPEPVNPASQPENPPAGESAATPEAAEGGTTCAVCGKQRPAGWSCGCGTDAERDAGAGKPGPMVPEGWDPALTRGTGPRLPLAGRQGGTAD